MARLVKMVVVPHEPTLPAAARGEGAPPAETTRQVLAEFKTLRRSIAEARPDVLVIVGNDHLCQFFMNNMPPFLIGKAQAMMGPPSYEMADWGLESYHAPIAGRLARAILTQGFERDVDFAYSDEFVADHAFTIPLNFLRPEGDLPIVPIFLNVLAPPVPPARRYLKVGQVVRQIIEGYDEDIRVAVIATGHLTNGVGGPYMMRHTQMAETAWDRTVHDLIVRNDIPGVVARSSWAEMYEQGNNTPGFLAYVFALGIADGAPISRDRYIPSNAHPLCLFLEWDEARLNGEAP
jgi:protocatechuate 4,5-dioxygenase beta chain